MITVLAAFAVTFNPLAGVQQTLAALDRRETVRLLFYGQSITQQSWTKTVAEDLQKRYPNANLIWENRAIGGFAADKLSRTLPADMMTFWPDLVIFHDYGGEDQYDPMIQWMRTHTSAEVLIQSDHVTWSPSREKPTEAPPRGEVWHDGRENSLRLLAEKWGCAFVDLRSQWRAELNKTKNPASHYLSDGVHLNDAGNELMARIVTASLRRDLSVRTAPAFVLRPGRSMKLAGAVRVDVRSAVDAQITGASETFVCPPSTGFGNIPLLKRATPGVNAMEEEWTLTLSQVKPDGSFFFKLEGDQTGPDGSGRSDMDFVSDSKRLKIEARDWEGAYLAMLDKNEWKDGYTARFRTVRLGDSSVPGDDSWHPVQYGPFTGELKADQPVIWRIWQPGSK